MVKNELKEFIDSLSLQKGQFTDKVIFLQNQTDKPLGLVKKEFYEDHVILSFKPLKYNSHMMARVDDKEEGSFVILAYDKIKNFSIENKNGERVLLYEEYDKNREWKSSFSLCEYRED